MMFVDGENLAIRYERLLDGAAPPRHVKFRPGAYVWSETLQHIGNPPVPFVRRYFYTAVPGSAEAQVQVHDELQELRFEAPRVFHKSKQRGSKRVDVSLTVDMLSHAHRKNYDDAILVAGDEDYLPLLEAVAAEGRRVFVWFFGEVVSQELRRRADHFFDLSHPFFHPLNQQHFQKGHYF